MNDKMEEWLKHREKQVQRFTHPELKAELLRQQIRELESQPLDPNSRHDILVLEMLKQRLAAVQQPASLASEGRAHMERAFEIARKGLATGIVPPDSEDILRDCQKWLETIERERRRGRAHELGLFRKGWRGADWGTRMGMARWLGRWTARHVVGRRLRYEAARVGMKVAIWISRR